MRFGRVDAACFGPASHRLAAAKMAGGDLDIEPFAARLKDGGTTYQSILTANVQSSLDPIDDIECSGIDIAFGDQASISAAQ